MTDNKIKVMIVEDEVLIAEVLKTALEKRGYLVTARLTSAEDAVIKAREDSPDVILMDICLAGQQDGIEAAIAIRKFSRSPVVFITGYSNKSYINRAAELDRTAYLQKPVIFPEIEKAINDLLKVA